MESPLDVKLSAALGGRTAAAFDKAFGLTTVGDLLSHYPRRYARRGELTALTQLPIDENVTIVAEVLEVRSRSMQARRGSILEVRISDGKGILTLNRTEKTGDVVALMEVLAEDEIMIITRTGMVIRSPVSQVRVAGRNTQGVKLVNLDGTDIVVAVARVVPDDKDEADDGADAAAPADGGELKLESEE